MKILSPLPAGEGWGEGYFQVKENDNNNQTKYIILLGDGMGDYPIPELNNQTVLEYAQTPNMDFIAQNGLLGRVRTVPDSFPPGSDVANLAVLGYDPRAYYTGRAPLEAASIGIDLSPTEVAFRCNLVTLKAGKMADFSAGHISTQEAQAIIETLREELGSEEFHFFSGTSYRHLLVWDNGREDLQCTPPHDISGLSIEAHLPKGKGAEKLLTLMEDSQRVLADHPINQKRIAEGKSPANSIWLWGQGKSPKLPSFQTKYQKTGAMISAVDLLKGIGRIAQLDIIRVPGATGYLDTNYQGKAEYALEALRQRDFVFVHVEAPDEAGHNGDLRAKIQAIEDFDRLVVGTVLKKIIQFSSYRIMVLPDHFTPISVKTHTPDPVPFAIFSGDKDTSAKTINKSTRGFSEGEAALNFLIEEGFTLMDYFLQRRQV